MNRREVVVALASVWPLSAGAQQPPIKIIRIGYLGAASPAEGARGLKAFRTGLSALGYVEGKSHVIDYRHADGQYERLGALAAELVRLPVDVLFAPTTSAALAARNATATIPIVFATVAAPVELGLVASLARPGGNITGLSFYISPEVIGKQLQLLQEIRAQISRVTILLNPSNAGSQSLLAETSAAAGLLKLQLQIIEARRPDDFEGAFRGMEKEHTDALLVLPDPMFSELRASLGALALKASLPTIFGSRDDLPVGGLMAYGPSRDDLIRRAAGYVDKILQGAKPADLPIEQPTKFELMLNLETAKALGLTIPESLLARADEVIE
jgi:putative tryptophan/tyrosine transport system substrate-binding protein